MKKREGWKEGTSQKRWKSNSKKRKRRDKTKPNQTKPNPNENVSCLPSQKNMWNEERGRGWERQRDGGGNWNEQRVDRGKRGDMLLFFCHSTECNNLWHKWQVQAQQSRVRETLITITTTHTHAHTHYAGMSSCMLSMWVGEWGNKIIDETHEAGVLYSRRRRRVLSINTRHTLIECVE